MRQLQLKVVYFKKNRNATGLMVVSKNNKYNNSVMQLKMHQS